MTVILRAPRSRRRMLTILTAGLLAASIGFAGPAHAFPDSWWYSYLNLAKAQKTSTGTGVTVAVIDTGVQASLPDLAGRVLPGRDFVDGGDARTDHPNAEAKYFGHGTAMAGFIAGTGKGASSGAGMVGVAPGAKILPAAVVDSDGEIDNDAAADAITWSVDHGAKVINLSNAGTTVCTPAYQQAVDYATKKDVIVVAGVGNSPGDPIGEPADCVGVIGIGALSDSSTFQAWSGENTGSDVDFIAPGQNLRGLLLTNQLSEPDGTGTSQSTAIASGIFALLRSKFPHDSARQIVTRAMYHVQNKVGTGAFGRRVDDRIGYGSLQPTYALSETTPATAKNPIYDEIDKHLRGASGSSTPATSGSADGSGAASGGASPGESGRAAPVTTDSGSSHTLLIALIVAAVVVVGIVVAVVTSASRRRTRAGGPGHPGGPGQPGI